MFVKKFGNKITGMALTKNEEKAMNLEIQRQIAEYVRKTRLEIMATFLSDIRDQFGFGPVRLKRIFKSVGKDLEELCRRYELDDSDAIWLGTRKLKEAGIDIEKWEEEEM